MPTINIFLSMFFLIVFTAHMMAWILSFCYKEPNEYVNPYRLVPRKEAESYKRYERQMYNDSLRNKKRKN